MTVLLFVLVLNFFLCPRLRRRWMKVRSAPTQRSSGWWNAADDTFALLAKRLAVQNTTQCRSKHSAIFDICCLSKELKWDGVESNRIVSESGWTKKQNTKSDNGRRWQWWWRERREMRERWRDMWSVKHEKRAKGEEWKMADRERKEGSAATESVLLNYRRVKWKTVESRS